MAESTIDAMIEQIKNLTALELSKLVKALEEEFGVSAAAPMMMGAMPAAGGAAEAVEEQTAFDVILAAAGDQKINVIKAVRELRADLGLKEAKDLVDGAPQQVLKGVKKEEADAAKEKLMAVGASVEVK